jgi:hypothetical protein
MKWVGCVARMVKMNVYRGLEREREREREKERQKQRNFLGRRRRKRDGNYRG